MMSRMNGFSYKIYPKKSSKKILFFFPAGFTSMRQYRWTVWQLNRTGVTVVGFNIDWKHLVGDLDPRGLIEFVEDVNQAVTEIQKKFSSEDNEYAAFGTSFGTVLALYVTKQNNNIRSLILNMPYGTLAHLIWTYKPAKSFKAKVKSQGIDTEDELFKLLQPIETQHDLSRLKDRKIINFTALNDKIVFDGQEFADVLKQVVPSATLHKTKYGHFWGGIENLLSKSKWDSVLKS